MIYAYRQFLEGLNILSEDEFKEVLEQFPGLEIDFLYLGTEYDATQEVLAHSIFNQILTDKWDSVFVDDTNWDRKEVILWDVQSIQDLEEIKATFPLWTIENYDKLVEGIKEQEEELKELEDKHQKDKLLDCLRQLSCKQLEIIIENHGLKR